MCTAVSKTFGHPQSPQAIVLFAVTESFNDIYLEKNISRNFNVFGKFEN